MRLLPSVVLQIQIKGSEQEHPYWKGEGGGDLRPADFVDVSERQMTVPSIGAVGSTPGLTGDATAKQKRRFWLTWECANSTVVLRWRK